MPGSTFPRYYIDGPAACGKALPRVAILERRPDQQLPGTRARGISSRTLEVLDQRGIVDRFRAAGQTAQVAGFALTRLDLGDFPARHSYGLALGQQQMSPADGSCRCSARSPRRRRC